MVIKREYCWKFVPFLVTFMHCVQILYYLEIFDAWCIAFMLEICWIFKSFILKTLLKSIYEEGLRLGILLYLQKEDGFKMEIIEVNYLLISFHRERVIQEYCFLKSYSLVSSEERFQSYFIIVEISWNLSHSFST